MTSNIKPEDYVVSRAAFEKAARQSQPQLAIAHLVTVVAGLEQRIEELKAEIAETAATFAASKRAPAKAAGSTES